MAENKFEKSVQQEMQGFKINPSEEIWPKVEKRIRKKKKRRIFIILFFLFGLGLLGYWQRNYFFDREKIHAEQRENSKEIKIGSVETVKKDSSIKDEDQTMQEKTVNTKEKPGLINPDQADQIKNNLLSIKTPPQRKTDSAKILNKKHGPGNNQRPNFATKPEKPVQAEVKTETPEKQDAVNQKEIAADISFENKTDSAKADRKNQKKEELIITENNPAEIKIDSAKINIEETQKEVEAKEENVLHNKSNTNRIKPDSNVTTLQKKTSSKKWEWGVHFSPGISSLAEDFFSFSMNKSASSLASPGSSTGGTVNQPSAPSASKAGFAFQSGVFLQKQITLRSRLSIGLQYGYYSEHINVGSRRDSILRYNIQVSGLRDANFVYGAARTTKNYTNRYHFIELPLVFQHQLNKKTSRPFYWNFGITAGQLVYTNAAVYDTSFGGIYYDNKKGLNRTHFSLSTGFAWSFFNKGKIKWNIGPGVDIHFNRIMNNPLDRNKYLLFTGIRATINFPGKK